MADSVATKIQKQLIREEILNRWNIRIPLSRAAKLTLDQLRAIRDILAN